MPGGAYDAKRHSEGLEWKNSRGQVYVQAPDHPNARKDGFVARARLVTEQRIGRYLLKSERVYHVDEQLDNDDPDNLMLFESQSDLARFRHAQYAELKRFDIPLNSDKAEWMKRAAVVAETRGRVEAAEEARLEKVRTAAESRRRT